MKNSFLKQLWVAARIWVIALAFNTFAGSVYMSGDIETEIVWAGLIFGSIFSLPILIILIIVINHCVSRGKSGPEIFWHVLLTGLTLTIFAAIFFLALTGAPPTLLFIAVIAAILGIGSHYYPLLKLARLDNEYENFLS